MSSASISSWSTSGTGSCQSCGSAGTSAPRYRATGPMSRCVSLYQAFAKASASSSGFSMKRFAMAAYAGVHPQGEIGRQHHGSVRLRRIVGIRHRADARAVLRGPLRRAGGALHLLPLVAVQVLQEVVVPLHRVGRPGALDATGDGIGALARAVAGLPAEALLLQVGALRLGTHVAARVGGAVRLAEGVPADDERDRLLVVHRHAPEGLADVPRRRDGIRLAVGPFGIHVDEAHLHRAEGLVGVRGRRCSARPRARCPRHPSRCPRAPTHPRGLRRSPSS